MNVEGAVEEPSQMMAPRAANAKRGIGFLIPSANTVLEEETIWVLPREVPARFARIRNARDSVRENLAMLAAAPEAASLLADAEVAVLAFACTSASMLRGVGYDRQLSDLLQQRTGLPAITTATSVVEALKYLGVGRVTLIAPYRASLLHREVSFLEESGIQVPAHASLNAAQPRQMERVTIKDMRACIKHMPILGEALFISCTNIHATSMVGTLEQELGIPVVTSNQATLWHAMQMLGLTLAGRGLGMLCDG